MTKEEIDILWNKAIRESVEDGTLCTRDRFAERVAEAERKVIMESLQMQADLAADALDRKWALEMIAAIRARGETK